METYIPLAPLISQLGIILISSLMVEGFWLLLIGSSTSSDIPTNRKAWTRYWR